jgi:putative membrane protein
MTQDWLLASVHHLLFVGLLLSLISEAALLRTRMTDALVRTLGKWDAVYGISAGLVLAIGLARAVYGAKGWAFYSGNPAFWLKLGVFALMGVVSIWPTVRFIQWRRALDAGRALPDEAQVASTRRLVMVQLALVPVVLVLAAAMARGIGY